MFVCDPKRSSDPSMSHLLHERHDDPINDGLVVEDQSRPLQQLVESGGIKLAYGLQAGIDDLRDLVLVNEGGPTLSRMRG
jgi:hypothetical protein